MKKIIYLLLLPAFALATAAPPGNRHQRERINEKQNTRICPGDFTDPFETGKPPVAVFKY